MTTAFVLTSFLSILLTPRKVHAHQLAPLKAPPNVYSWAAIIERARSLPSLAYARKTLVEHARRQARYPLIEGAAQLEGLKEGEGAAGPGAISLCGDLWAEGIYAQRRRLAESLPLLATAYRLSTERQLLRRIEAQLEEIAGWPPLTRAGSEAGEGVNSYPTAASTATLLSVGYTLRAVGDALEILPKRRLPLRLEERIRGWAETEVAGLQQVWEEKSAWFIRYQHPLGSHWLLACEGLVRGALLLGRKQGDEIYEAGVRRLLESLEAHAAAGFIEGLDGAVASAGVMLHTARAMARQEDFRALEHPFLKGCVDYLLHQLQPETVVCTAGESSRNERVLDELRTVFAMLACYTESAQAQWALDTLMPPALSGLPGLAARAFPAPHLHEKPTPFLLSEAPPRLYWRSGWEAGADSIRVRFGQRLDSEGHRDCGHVSYSAQSRAILIEAGSPAPTHPLRESHFKSGVGHNVLQIGESPSPDQAGDSIAAGCQHPGGQASMRLISLGEWGGSVLIDATTAYRGLKHWRRYLRWDRRELYIEDDVALFPPRCAPILFRWHLGTEGGVDLIPVRDGVIANWADAEVLLTGSAPFVVELHRMPDNSLPGHDGRDYACNTHVCLVVRTLKAVDSLQLETRVRAH